MDVGQLVINTIVFQSQLNRGQAQHEWFEAVSNLGVRHVEVRQEYFHRATDLDDTATEAGRRGIQLLYSVPQTLFRNGRLNTPTVNQCIEEATRLGANAVKFTRGEYINWDAVSLRDMRDIMNNFGGFVTVENDQTETDGTVFAQLQFLEDCESANIPLYATFDVGNWYWVGEDPLLNAKRLHHFIRYMHLKDVHVSAQGPQAVPLGEGEIPLESVLGSLPENLLTALEYPCGADPLRQLALGIKWLGNLCKGGDKQPTVIQT